MKHNRLDYQDRIIDMAGIIPEDEPVFVLRAQDPIAARAVRHWAQSLRNAGGDPAVCDSAERQAEAMEAFGRGKALKLPTLASPELLAEIRQSNAEQEERRLANEKKREEAGAAALTTAGEKDAMTGAQTGGQGVSLQPPPNAPQERDVLYQGTVGGGKATPELREAVANQNQESASPYKNYEEAKAAEEGKVLDMRTPEAQAAPQAETGGQVPPTTNAQ